MAGVARKNVFLIGPGQVKESINYHIIIIVVVIVKVIIDYFTTNYCFKPRSDEPP